MKTTRSLYGKLTVLCERRLKGHSTGILGLRFSSDGQILASASSDQTVKLWRLDGTELTTLIGHSATVWSVAFSPDNQLIASGGDDKTIKLWKPDDTGWHKAQPLRTLKGHGARVYQVTFSPNGQIIASASADRTVKLWKLDGTMLTTLTRHSSIVWDVDFSPDSKTIASASEDQTVILWDLQRILKLDELAYGCSWVQDYLRTNADVAEGDRTLCKGVAGLEERPYSGHGTR